MIARYDDEMMNDESLESLEFKGYQYTLIKDTGPEGTKARQYRREYIYTE